MNDVRVARITGACGLACVALSVGQFPLWLGDYPSFYDGPEFARHLFAIKNIAFTRILIDQGIYVSMLVFAAGLRHLVVRHAQTPSGLAHCTSVRRWVGWRSPSSRMDWRAAPSSIP